MGIHELTGDEKAQTETLACRTLVVNPVEPVEHMRQDVRGNPWSMISHLDLRDTIRLAQGDFDRASPAAEGHGIDQQIEQHLLDAAGITRNNERSVVALKTDRLLAGDDLNRVQHTADESGEVEWRALDREGRGGEPDNIDDLVRKLGEAGASAARRGLYADGGARRQTARPDARQDRSRGRELSMASALVARYGQELLLQMPEAAVGDVADDDDASLLRAIDQQWLTRSSYHAVPPRVRAG